MAVEFQAGTPRYEHREGIIPLLRYKEYPSAVPMQVSKFGAWIDCVVRTVQGGGSKTVAEKCDPVAQSLVPSSDSNEEDYDEIFDPRGRKKRAASESAPELGLHRPKRAAAAFTPTPHTAAGALTPTSFAAPGTVVGGGAAVAAGGMMVAEQQCLGKYHDDYNKTGILYRFNCRSPVLQSCQRSVLSIYSSEGKVQVPSSLLGGEAVCTV